MEECHAAPEYLIFIGHERAETGQSFGKAAGLAEGKVMRLFKEIVN